MSPDFIIDVTETDFEYEVMQYSLNTPVIVDFWAPWCQPCKIISPLLENLAREGNGFFRLAKVNTDQNPNLALRFGVRSLPTIKAFVQEQVVGEFVGSIPEIRIREFLSKLMPPSPISLAVEKAESILAEHQWRDAELEFKDILTQDPGQLDAILGLSIALLGQGKASEALPILSHFPASKQYSQAEKLLPLAETLDALHRGTLPDDKENDATYANCIRLASRGNIPAALDGLLDVIRREKNYREGLARQVYLGLLELLGESDPQTRQYRSELASVLF
ncbi:MAG: tetratricopeptide repeat protein [Anaerolineae bacterium]|nr:tetratricopeptide repeat protein [Anaerolineae bacterium]